MEPSKRGRRKTAARLLPVLHPDAAGIDVGAEEVYVTADGSHGEVVSVSARKTTDTWSWPIDAARYDRARGLSAGERRFLAVDLPLRSKFSKTRQPSLDAVHRLVRPLHDVFDHMEYRGQKRRSLVFYLLEEMGRRNSALWAWTDAEWIEIVESRRYNGNHIIAAAFMLRGFALGDHPKAATCYHLKSGHSV